MITAAKLRKVLEYCSLSEKKNTKSRAQMACFVISAQAVDYWERFFAKTFLFDGLLPFVKLLQIHQIYFPVVFAFIGSNYNALAVNRAIRPEQG